METKCKKGGRLDECLWKYTKLLMLLIQYYLEIRFGSSYHTVHSYHSWSAVICFSKMFFQLSDLLILKILNHLPFTSLTWRAVDGEDKDMGKVQVKVWTSGYFLLYNVGNGTLALRAWCRLESCAVSPPCPSRAAPRACGSSAFHLTPLKKREVGSRA